MMIIMRRRILIASAVGVLGIGLACYWLLRDRPHDRPVNHRELRILTAPPPVGARASVQPTQERLPSLKEVMGRINFKGFTMDEKHVRSLVTEAYRQGLQMELAEDLYISGRVTDSSGKPVATARVLVTIAGGLYYKVFPMLGKPFEFSQDVDAKGKYHIQGLYPNTAYIVMALADGYLRRYPTEQVTLLNQGEAIIGITPDKRVVELNNAGVEGIDLVLDKGATISGKVVDTLGKHVAGAKVSLQFWSRKAATLCSYDYYMEKVSAGRDGRFELKGVPPGEYSFWIEAPEAKGGFPPLDRPTIRVAGVGQDVRNITLVIEAATHGETDGAERVIGGVVTNDQGQPVSGADIRLEGTECRLEARTDERGDFWFSRIPYDESSWTDSVALTVRHPEYVTRMLDDIVVGTRDLVIVLEPLRKGSISGVVVDGATGEPLENVQVHLVRGAGSTLQTCILAWRPSPNSKPIATTGSDGSFWIEIRLEGTIVLFFSRAGYAERVVAVPVRHEENTSGVRVEMVAGGRLEAQIVETAGTGEIGWYDPCVYVRSEHAEANVMIDLARGEDGVFGSQLPPGTYGVYLRALCRTVEGGRQTVERSMRAEVRSGQTTRVEFVLGGAAELRAQIEMRDVDASQSSALLVLRPASAAEPLPPDFGSWELPIADIADFGTLIVARARSRCTVRGLEPGTYVVTALLLLLLLLL